MSQLTNSTLGQLSVVVVLQVLEVSSVLIFDLLDPDSAL
jgi:hypothetical protein